MIDEEFIRVQYQTKACKVEWLLSKAKNKAGHVFLLVSWKKYLEFYIPRY